MTPPLRPLGGTGISIAPLVLGTNVFGWTAVDLRLTADDVAILDVASD